MTIRAHLLDGFWIGIPGDGWVHQDTGAKMTDEEMTARLKGKG